MKTNTSYKGFLFLTLLFLAPFFSKAQLLIIQDIVPVETKYSDTWQATVNNMEKPVTAIADLKVSKDGKLWLQAKTQPFYLPKGETRIYFSSLKIDGINIKPGNSFSWNQFLGQGSYEICLHVQSIENTPEGESCTPLEILPLAPPLLVSPENGSPIADPMPLLTWSPPMPLNVYEHLQYNLTLVELMPMQSAYEALARNKPLLSLKNYSDLVYQYTLSNIPLIPGKEYAWQVSAYDGGKLIGKTEVWKFSIKKESPRVKEEILPDYYYKLSGANSVKSHGTAKGCIGFTCEEEVLEGMTYKIADKNDQVVEMADMRLKPASQANYYILYMNDSRKMKEGQMYRLYIYTTRGSKYYLDFVYKIPETK